jgi:hypothetical protein
MPRSEFTGHASQGGTSRIHVSDLSWVIDAAGQRGCRADPLLITRNPLDKRIDRSQPPQGLLRPTDQQSMRTRL